MPDDQAPRLLADRVPDPNITRAMGLVPVNALKVTSVVGHIPATDDDEFRVTRHSNRLGKTSGGHQAADHWGNKASDNRGKGDQNKDDGKGHRQ